MTEQPTRSPGAPDFGPGGYLPERAAHRARKIILREQMSAGWPLAALVAAAVLVVTAGLFLLTRAGPPAAPFEAVADLAAVSPGTSRRVPLSSGGEALLVHTGSAVRAFEAPAVDAAWCAGSGHLEGPEGSVWNPSGQRIGGQAGSLATYPVELHGGTVYVDATSPRPAPPPAPGQAAPACH